MNILKVRRLVDKYTISELHIAEFAIIQDQPLNIEIEVKDQAQTLSEVIAAVWILEEMKNKDLDFREALCEYSKKVRIGAEI